ncbi:MAG: hypothetical protein ACK5QH_02515 [Rubrivivax sp.]|jgi:hypothetical protein
MQTDDLSHEDLSTLLKQAVAAQAMGQHATANALFALVVERALVLGG